MDKFEYKVKVDEIKSLIQSGAFEDAVDVADTVEWSSVKNVRTLCMISDLYKKNRLFEESRNILLLAYSKQKARSIIKSLCELSIELNDLIGAIEYCKEFVQVAPKDPNKYVLKYKIYKAQGVSLEEQIEVLEELKAHEPMEKWAYELAGLYHKVGLADKCVEECNEIITWFVDGKYVMKAFELKALHKPLTEQEVYKYELLRQAGGELNIQYSLTENEKEVSTPKKDLEVKNVDVSPYNTQNLQAVVAQGLHDYLEKNTTPLPEIKPESLEEARAMDEEALAPSAPEVDPELMVTTMYNPIIQEEAVGQDLESDEESVQAGDKPVASLSDTAIIGDAANEMAANILREKEYKLHQDTDEMKLISDEDLGISSDSKEEVSTESEQDIVIPKQVEYSKDVHDANEAIFEQKIGAPTSYKPNFSNTGIIETFNKGTNMDEILSQEYDGQISLVVPDTPNVEKQITGQISIEDVMKEWELKKKASEAKRIEQVRAQVRKQTDGLLANFDEATKSGLLEQIEKTVISATLMEENKPKQIKVSDISSLDEEPKTEEPKTEEPIKTAPVTPKINEEMPKDVASDDEVEELEDAPADIEENIEGIESEEEFSEEEYTDDEAVEEFEDDEDEPDEEDLRESAPRNGVRELSEAEKEQFAAFIHHKSTRKQLAEALDNITLASYTGNVLVTSEEDNEITTFSKLLVKEIQMSDANFTGKVAKVSGENLNRKDIVDTLKCVSNGALIISEAEGLKKKTVETLIKELQSADRGVVVVMQGHGDVIDKIVEKNVGMAETFNLRIDLKAFDNKTLVEYAKSYAYDNEYSIDELGILALHTRIDDMQTSDHEVTLSEIEEIIDEAIYYADKKTPTHFFDILFGKRYDEEDMIVLREKDFMH